MKWFYIIPCWFVLIGYPFYVMHFLESGIVDTKWGRFSGSEGRDMVIAHGILALLLGYYAIKETIIEIKKRIK